MRSSIPRRLSLILRRLGFRLANSTGDNWWEFQYVAGNNFPVFDTRQGKAGLASKRPNKYGCFAQAAGPCKFVSHMPARPHPGPKSSLGYVNSRLERAAERRPDGAALAVLSADRGAGVYVIGGELIVLKKAVSLNDPLFTFDEARALSQTDETVFLGLLGRAGRFGVGIPPASAEALKANRNYVVTDLRSIAVQGLVDSEHLPPIAEAKAVLNWHLHHRFCPNCGTGTQAVCGGWRRDCPSCNAEHFPRTDPVVIMLAIDGGHCLLGRSPRFLPTMWSCLAGFIEPGE